MKNFIRTVTLLLATCMLLPATAQVALPRLVRDSMVLQRDQPIHIWGRATAGEKVSVQFNRKKYKTITGKDGRWQIVLSPTAPGGPYTMQIDGRNHLTLHDILVGDVWFCSGQSNMVHQLKLHADLYQGVIDSAHYPWIRHFTVPTNPQLAGPQSTLTGGYWKWANPENVRDFSAVAYFFALQLYNKYKVPIGLINASVGGTPIEAWMSEQGLQAFPDILQTVQKDKDTGYVNQLLRAMASRPAPPSQDQGLKNNPLWYDPTYQPIHWRPINIPGYWEDQGIRNLDGVVWYRRSIEVPATFSQQEVRLTLGRIVDADEVYVNGKKIGATGYQYPQRRYTVPAGLLQAGKNLLVIRVTNYAGKGGFVADKPYYLAAGGDTLDLKGTWQYRVGEVFAPSPGTDVNFSAQNSPVALYNGMVAPLIPYTIKGIAWYQGESNTGNPQLYRRLLPALIKDWRDQWKQDTLPFVYVQLPGFMEVQYLPGESNWAILRDAQRQALSVPHTGMAVAIDLGEWNDVHPDRKKEVGDRLALAAAAVAYHDTTIVSSGPLYQSATIDNNKIIVSFTHTGSGLVAIDHEPLSEFAIAGADKKFVWAWAQIEGDKVVVWSSEVPHPKYVRYAWADNPFNPNLYNREGLPAAPFKTDPD